MTNDSDHERETSCSDCGQHALLCLRGAWTVAEITDGTMRLGFACHMFGLEVRLPTRAGAWCVSVTRSEAAPANVAEGRATLRMQAIEEVAAAIAAEGYFEPLSREAIAASIVVATSTAARNIPALCRRDARERRAAELGDATCQRR